MTGTDPHRAAPMPHAYRVEKQSFSRGAWRVLDAATGEQVNEIQLFDHPNLGRIRIPGPLCFDRKRDALAWVAAHEEPTEALF